MQWLLCEIHTDASLSIPRRHLSAGIVVTIDGEIYRMAVTGPFVACSMAAEAWAAWQGVRYAKEILCGAHVPMVHYTDSAGLASAVKARKYERRFTPFYKTVRKLCEETEGWEWKMAWKSRKHPDMREPHNLAASV